MTYILHAEHLAPEYRTVCQSLMLETPTGEFELARLRAAVGQHEPEQASNVEKLRGAGPLQVTVEHRAAEGSPDVILCDVRVA